MNSKGLRKIMVDREVNGIFLAKSLGISPTALYSKMKGHTQFTYDEIQNIKNVLDLNVEEFAEVFPF